MARERVTSLQVAARAGVSQSAVSRVFSGASASAATIEKVRRAADELGYRPNVLARSLITGKSRIVGLAVAQLDNQFYPNALERLSNALQAQGYHLMIFTVERDDDGKRADKVIAELLDHQVEGIVTASVGMTDQLTRRCDAAGIPVVLFNRGQDDARLSEVTSDNIAGARRIAEFLVAGGHKRIAHIAGWTGASTGRDRSAGFRAGLTAAGQSVWREIDGRYSRELAADATRALFGVGEKPDAIFAANDHMAFAVIDTLRHNLGLRVPQDVSVVGYDDVPMASWGAYDLTTLRQPAGQMIDATVQLMLERIADPKTPPRKVRIAGPLQVRGSARVPEGWT